MSKIEVDTIDKQSGSTLTLGGSGTAVTLASGATQTGFGRTGTVDWQTAIKTSTITVVNGEGYFVNTTGGAITANLPAGSAGAIAAFRDYANTFDSNALTVNSNGSEKINGLTKDLIVSTEGESITLVYADATKGWLVVNDGNNDAGVQAEFVTATGGNATVTCGNFKTHIFTGPGTLCVSNAGNATGSTTVDYLVIAGGGGGGTVSGATGGGAGGFRVSNSYSIPAPTMSPLSNPTGLPVSVQGYTIAVGGGGAGGAKPSNDGVNGSVSTFSTITSTGGGKGRGPGNGTGYAGGSGSGGKGAAGAPVANGYAGGAGNTPPVSPSQGNNGGAGYDGFCQSTNGGGGGGAGAVGVNAGASAGGAGGAGSYVADGFINPTSPSYGTPGPVSSTRFFSGGGGGTTCGGPGGQPVTFGVGGAGGGGAGASAAGSSGGSATVNTGGGGGGGIGNPASPGGAGGSGIVMIRYKFQ